MCQQSSRQQSRRHHYVQARQRGGAYGKGKKNRYLQKGRDVYWFICVRHKCRGSFLRKTRTIYWYSHVALVSHIPVAVSCRSSAVTDLCSAAIPGFLSRIRISSHPGFRIPDPTKMKSLETNFLCGSSGMEKIRIQDPGQTSRIRNTEIMPLSFRPRRARTCWTWWWTTTLILTVSGRVRAPSLAPPATLYSRPRYGILVPTLQRYRYSYRLSRGTVPVPYSHRPSSGTVPCTLHTLPLWSDLELNHAWLNLIRYTYSESEIWPCSPNFRVGNWNRFRILGGSDADHVQLYIRLHNSVFEYSDTIASFLDPFELASFFRTRIRIQGMSI